MLFRGLMMVLTAIFRGFGDSRTPMIINIGINLLNVVGNYLLIYSTHDVTLFGHTFTVWGAGWGVAGAALSTSGSQIALYVFHPALRSNAHFDSRELPPQQRDHSGGFPGQLAGYV